MKGLQEIAELINTYLFLRISILAITAVVSFYLGRYSSDAYLQLAFFSVASTSNANAPLPSPPSAPAVFLSPNSNRSVNDSSAVPSGSLRDSVPVAPPLTDLVPPPRPLSSPPPPLAPPPPLPTRPERTGIVDDNGRMTEDFDAGGFDAVLPDEPDDAGRSGNETAAGGDRGLTNWRIRVEKFRVCPESMRDNIPCMDNDEVIKKLQSTERGERFERHCPETGKGLDCLVPKPRGYKTPITWPRSRDEVWYNNVRHTHLVDDKGWKNWIKKAGDKFIFGTQFTHAANQYLDQISQMVPDIAFGKHTRVALDIGCGVASFGAFLFSRNVVTMSIAPKDVHQNQIQFALERGVPAMVAAFATHRLPYPSQAFDLVHCSRCGINWTQDDGILLLEVNRLLRAGGYFVWAAHGDYKDESSLQEVWKVMENLTSSICWQLVKKEGYIAIWQKPLNNSCYAIRDSGHKPPLCDAEDQANSVWYVKLKPCITQLPENGFGANITEWPFRLNEPPQRLQEVEMDAYLAKNEIFKADTEYWVFLVEVYVRVYRWNGMKLRNVMDMSAGFGGFAAALIKQKIDLWVMNVVPIWGPNTLPVIYDRGLIGAMHDWCEPFDTYPRTYDLLHAFGLFSKENERCNSSVILLEMDRLLRPGGHAYIHDSRDVVSEVQEVANAMGWRTSLRDSYEGAYASRKNLICDKTS